MTHNNTEGGETSIHDLYIGMRNAERACAHAEHNLVEARRKYEAATSGMSVFEIYNKTWEKPEDSIAFHYHLEHGIDDIG